MSAGTRRSLAIGMVLAVSACGNSTRARPAELELDWPDAAAQGTDLSTPPADAGAAPDAGKVAPSDAGRR